MGENGFSEGYAVGVSQNSNGFGNGMWGSDWIWVILLLALFGGGWGNNGFGGNGGGIGQNYVLATDFATIERKLDGVNNGLCDGFYSTAQQINGVQQTLCQGFAGINQNIVSQGYESRLATNALMQQLADCCCDIKGGIKDNTTQGIMNTNMISKQISDCCCDLEKMNMQTRFDAQQNTCTTLQAIDKVGDRIIDYLATEKTQTLRDENFALKLAASQAQQNNFLISKLGDKCPEPAYIVQPPQQVTFPTNCCGGVNFAAYNNGCGCGCGCN